MKTRKIGYRMRFQYYPIVLLIVVTLLTACAGKVKKGDGEDRSARLHIQIAGSETSDTYDGGLVIHYIQYSLDGRLLLASQIGKDFDHKFTIDPGKHHLYVETASRGILGARAFLNGDGQCYTFQVDEGQTALFKGKVLSSKEWEAEGFPDIQFTTKESQADGCR